MSTVTSGSKSAGWAINDAVTGLRPWGKRGRFALPSDIDVVVLGAAEGCTIRMQDEFASVSRQHAELTRDGETWTLKDLGSKNGSRLDGEQRLFFPLAPGVEIEIGRIKLIAESRRLIELQRFLARILGFGDAQLGSIDEALRGIRDAGARRGSLMLRGAGSLVSTARRIHQLALGADRPFVVADRATLRDAVQSATGGTLCLEGMAERSDVSYVNEVGACTLVICAPAVDKAGKTKMSKTVEQVHRTTIVDVPPLELRKEETAELLLEYGADAVHALGATGAVFREHETVWLRDVTVDSLEDAESLTWRLVHERLFGPTLGAAKLGITHRALSEYLRRRGIPL